jgi:GTP-binding protein
LFLDYAKIHLKSGNGGAGAVSFRREKYVPRGGPDGGDGGRGGHVILKVDGSLSTLSDFRYRHHFEAGNGNPGEAMNRYGKDGADLIIPVPVGTVIRDAETQRIIADLTQPGKEFIILQGGRGGRGNARFSTPTRQTPRFSEKGELGAELWAELELKLIADVGLIGFPNAGKSTLLAQISAARPKIADYPFTTLEPNLGVVEHKGNSFVAVDIPGLIEGAHLGVGLGHRFLRHVERTRLLVHLVDLSGLSERDPYQDFLQINRELELYNPELAQKPQLVAANKMDLPESRENYRSFAEKIVDRPIHPISGATGEGIETLLNQIIQKLNELPKDVTPIEEPANPEVPGTDYEIRVTGENGVFTVHNEALLKRVARFDLNNEESIRSLQKLLKHWGVEPALLKAGVKEGDSVQIGEFEFTYVGEE